MVSEYSDAQKQDVNKYGKDYNQKSNKCADAIGDITIKFSLDDVWNDDFWNNNVRETICQKILEL